MLLFIYLSMKLSSYLLPPTRAHPHSLTHMHSNHSRTHLCLALQMNSPLPIPCHQPSSSISSSEALSHALKTEDFVTPYAYEQHFNHHLCFDPNLQQPDGLNVTGLMRIMPFVSAGDQRLGGGGGGGRGVYPFISIFCLYRIKQ